MEGNEIKGNGRKFDEMKENEMERIEMVPSGPTCAKSAPPLGNL